MKKEKAMQWLNEPSQWSAEDGVLTVIADAGTDFWRTTGNGSVRDNGHLYGEALVGDFELSMRMRGSYADQYDQSGAMVRIDDRHWLKTGIEYFEGRRRFSTVITFEYSSWAIAELPPQTEELRLLVIRHGDAIDVRYALDDGPDELAAIAYLPPHDEALAGAMCAAPEGNGFPVTFYDLAIRPLDRLATWA
jgi:regulation of enolase protein 1 (concanavalin A-like superfamily)